jgi:hypothetical protein
MESSSLTYGGAAQRLAPTTDYIRPLGEPRKYVTEAVTFASFLGVPERLRVERGRRQAIPPIYEPGGRVLS